MGEVKPRGIKLPPLICRGATVAPSTKVGENCMVGAGAIVGAHCDIAVGTHHPATLRTPVLILGD